MDRATATTNQQESIQTETGRWGWGDGVGGTQATTSAVHTSCESLPMPRHWRRSHKSIKSSSIFGSWAPMLRGCVLQECSERLVLASVNAQRCQRMLVCSVYEQAWRLRLCERRPHPLANKTTYGRRAAHCLASAMLRAGIGVFNNLCIKDITSA